MQVGIYCNMNIFLNLFLNLFLWCPSLTRSSDIISSTLHVVSLPPRLPSKLNVSHPLLHMHDSDISIRLRDSRPYLLLTPQGVAQLLQLRVAVRFLAGDGLLEVLEGRH